ncbi:antitoxin [uncultured Thiocystis sp.]|jgi:hypothetical protein|uniref:antitoxin n=1 Tax=uncultured Thiocystis sp. TaxID=1202134 RepID=UPI0025F8725B|nr:antitoxin [uncultured Thiocystis sp.]
MANLSVRGLDSETVATLKSMASAEGSSVNALVLRLIGQGLGKLPRQIKRHHDLDALMGAWSAEEAEEAEEFDTVCRDFEQIDPMLWSKTLAPDSH